MDDVQNIIAKLSITKKYNGYYYSVMGIRILLENPDKCLKITKDIYPPIASKYSTTSTNVSHGIRTVVRKAWDFDKNLLEEMAEYKLDKSGSLTNMEFLSIVADYIARTRKLENSAEKQ